MSDRSDALRLKAIALEVLDRISKDEKLNGYLLQMESLARHFIEESGCYAISMTAFDDFTSAMIHPIEGAVVSWEGSLEVIKEDDVFVDTREDSNV